MKKVLVWGLTNNRAGTEAVIVNYASRAKNVSFDFLCYEEPLNHWEKLNRNGNRYFVIPSKIKDLFHYRPALARFMREHASEYDAFWFNVNDAANIDPLKYAMEYGIPKGIVHMHNSQLSDSFLTRFFHTLNYNGLRRLGTDYWACSESAATFLGHGEGTKIIPNIIDPQDVGFSLAKREELRAKFGLGESLVIGFVGRLTYQKNPGFLVELMPALLERNPRVRLVLVGTGELAEELEKMSISLGIDSAISLVGIQDDLQGFLSAFDVYAQPSRYEGFGISILEAQFNGLPCVVSDAVPSAVDVTGSILHLSTSDKGAWIDALLQADRSTVELLPRARAYDAVEATNMIESLF